MEIKKYLLVSFFALILLLSSVACKNIDSGALFGRFDRTRYTSSMDSCLYDPADYIIHNSVLSLEVFTNNNHAMGFDILKGFLSLFSVKFKSKSSKLSMRSALTTTLQDHYDAVGVNSEAKLENKQWNFYLGVSSNGELDCENTSGILSGGTCLDHFRNTPINDLVYTALENGFRKLIDNVDNKYGDEWRSRIVQKPESFIDHFFIPVGDYANVKEGDVFKIHNIEHSFRGVPCGDKSKGNEYLGFSKTTQRPLAHVRVIATHPFSSLVEVVPEYSWNLNGVPSHKHIQFGALVEIASLSTPSDRRLSRSVKLGVIKSLELEFAIPHYPDGNLDPGTGTANTRNVNLTALVCENIKTVAGEYGFYVYIEDREREHIRCGGENPFWEEEVDSLQDLIDLIGS